MKVVIARLLQESNSFSAVNSDMGSFEAGGILVGEELLRESGGANTQLSAFVRVLRESDAQIIPTVSMRCVNSCGRVTRDVFDHFMGEVTRVLRENLPVDGFFLGFHGATQLTDDDDALGLAVRTIRELIGDKAVISVTTDYHANITKRAVRYADYICGYLTYPHVDIYETGLRAANIGVMSIKEGRKFPMAHVKLPMLLQAEASQTNRQPMQSLTEYSRALVEREGLIDYSFYQMQPWLDVYEGGSTVLVIARERDKAVDACKRIAQRYWELRGQIRYRLSDLDEVIDLAVSNRTGKPVILSDSADSPSAGSTGDSTAVLSRLLERDISIPAILTVADPEVPTLAEKAGVGGTARFLIGGKFDRHFFRPVEIDAYVKAICDGRFISSSPVQLGERKNLGKTAVLVCGSVTIVCCERPTANYDPQIYTAFGVDPAQAKLVVVKSAAQYREHYAGYSDLMYTVDTPGAASANLFSFEYKHLPRPSYPFEDVEYVPDNVLIARE